MGISIPYTRAYKPLGYMFHFGGTAVMEVSHRVGQASAALRTYSKSLFANKDLL